MRRTASQRASLRLAPETDIGATWSPSVPRKSLLETRMATVLPVAGGPTRNTYKLEKTTSVFVLIHSFLSIADATAHMAAHFLKIWGDFFSSVNARKLSIHDSSLLFGERDCIEAIFQSPLISVRCFLLRIEKANINVPPLNAHSSFEFIDFISIDYSCAPCVISAFTISCISSMGDVSEITEFVIAWVFIFMIDLIYWKVSC